MRVSPQRGAVDGGEGADLHVVLDHHDADLRDLLVAAVRVAREAEAVAADHRAVLHHHAVAEPAALAHLHARSAARSPRRPPRPRRARRGGGSRVRAPIRTPAAHHGQRRPRARLRPARRVGSTCAEACTPAAGRGCGCSSADGARVGQVGVVREQAGQRRLELGGEDHGRRARRGQLRGVARVGHEGEVARRRRPRCPQTRADLDARRRRAARSRAAAASSRRITRRAFRGPRRRGRRGGSQPALRGAARRGDRGPLSCAPSRTASVCASIRPLTRAVSRTTDSGRQVAPEVAPRSRPTSATTLASTLRVLAEQRAARSARSRP